MSFILIPFIIKLHCLTNTVTVLVEWLTALSEYFDFSNECDVVNYGPFYKKDSLSTPTEPLPSWYGLV